MPKKYKSLWRRLKATWKWFYVRRNIKSALAMAGIAGPLVLVICDITASIAAARAEGYNVILDSISSLALTDLGFILTIGFMAIGLLVEIFVAGLLYSIKPAKWFHAGIGMLVFFGFALLLIGAFRTDPVDSPATIEGTIHGVMAMVAFWLFPLAVLALSRSIKSDPRWSGLYRYTMVTFVLALIMAILVATIRDIIGWFGLLERLLVANMVIWVGVMAARMLYLSVNPSAIPLRENPEFIIDENTEV